MRRTSNITTWLVAALLVVGGSALAQTTDSQEQAPPTSYGHRHGMRGMDVQQRLQHMSQQLNLTDDQKAKIQPILEEEVKQMQALRQDTSLSRDQKRDKMMQIHQSTQPQIEAVLTPEQKDKLAQMREQRKQQYKSRMNKQQDNSTPPPQN